MNLDLVPLWAGILALSVFMYVLLDGFDLGVGILSRHAPGAESRDMMMNSVAPIWDGNETWLVMGGLALLSAFPLAFAILMPALYFPLLFMLLGLLFRGVAFEFRVMPGTHKHFWGLAFHWGSLLATFAQGVVLGNFVEGIPVAGRQFAGGSFDWIRPFALLVGVGLIFGYGLLGACWLVMKTEGELQRWARKQARWLLFGVLAFIAMVSIWTPFMQPRVYERWFSWPNIAFLSPVPVITLGIAWWLWDSLDRRREIAPFLAAMGLFLMCYLGLAISIWPMVVPYEVSLWDASASSSSQAFLALGTLFLLPLIMMYFAWSYWVFRGKVRADVGYHASH
jgi:cytochrome d ubiquinol oxidase subunit II